MTLILDRIVDVIRGYRFVFIDEDELQEGLAAALTQAGLHPKREVRLDARSRVDILVERVAIEVKVGGSTSALERQLTRYAESDRVDALIVVTSRVMRIRFAPSRGQAAVGWLIWR